MLRLKLEQIKKSLKDYRHNSKKYADEFLASLNEEGRKVQIIASSVATFAWLGFAFDTDPKLHPDFPELLYFRLGLTVTSLIVFFASLFEKTRGRGLGWLYILMTYATITCAYFTARIASDSVYVAGFQIILFIIAMAPFRLRFSISLYAGAAIVFIVSFFYYDPISAALAKADISTQKTLIAQVKYSMNNLVIVFIFAPMLAVVLSRFRFSVFLKAQELEVLNERQRGDYFLTSSLIKPLMTNSADHPNLKVDMVLNQYTSFAFRKWQSEIGGDLSVAENIHLHNRSYTVYLNADAMGKSIQGAGGALVLGTVFKTILSRTMNTSTGSKQYPEQWLRHCYLELQDVFTTFEGSMNISAVLGVIDNVTGYMYYINVEHPWIALYRDGKASFIEDELQLRKFGVVHDEDMFYIKTFQLQNHDKLIFGSDGRDDLLLGVRDDGSRIINEDEMLFLKLIEDYKGNIFDIEQYVIECGVTDDLSLVSITYLNQVENSLESQLNEDQIINSTLEPDDMEEVFHSIGDNQPLAMRLFRMYIKKKHLKQAYVLCKVFTNNNPEHYDFLYLGGYVAKLLYRDSRDFKYLKEGADFAERCRLRDRSMVKNLINLANIYLLLKNSPRAKTIISEVEFFEPNNDKLKRLKLAI